MQVDSTSREMWAMFVAQQKAAAVARV